MARVYLGIGEPGPPGPPGVRANWRGIYNAGTTYALGDGVEDGSGNQFVSNISANVGNAPDTHNTGDGSGTQWSPMGQADAIIDSSGNGTADCSTSFATNPASLLRCFSHAFAMPG
jgi:hypothetical protein